MGYGEGNLVIWGCSKLPGKADLVDGRPAGWLDQVRPRLIRTSVQIMRFQRVLHFGD